MNTVSALQSVEIQAIPKEAIFYSLRWEKDGDYLAEILTEKGQAVVALASGLFSNNQKLSEKDKYLADVPVKFNREEIREKLDKIL